MRARKNDHHDSSKKCVCKCVDLNEQSKLGEMSHAEHHLTANMHTREVWQVIESPWRLVTASLERRKFSPSGSLARSVGYSSHQSYYSQSQPAVSSETCSRLFTDNVVLFNLQLFFSYATSVKEKSKKGSYISCPIEDCTLFITLPKINLSFSLILKQSTRNSICLHEFQRLNRLNVVSADIVL